MLTSAHASLASRIERDILISNRCGVHDKILGTLRIDPPDRRSDGARAAGTVGTGAGGVSGDAEAAVSAAARRRRAQTRAIKSSSSSLAHRRNMPASRPGSTSVTLSSCATRRLRSWSSRLVEIWFGARSRSRTTFWSTVVSDDHNACRTSGGRPPAHARFARSPTPSRAPLSHFPFEGR